MPGRIFSPGDARRNETQPGPLGFAVGGCARVATPRTRSQPKPGASAIRDGSRPSAHRAYHAQGPPRPCRSTQPHLRWETRPLQRACLRSRRYSASSEEAHPPPTGRRGTWRHSPHVGQKPPVRGPGTVLFPRAQTDGHGFRGAGGRIVVSAPLRDEDRDRPTACGSQAGLNQPLKQFKGLLPGGNSQVRYPSHEWRGLSLTRPPTQEAQG